MKILILATTIIATSIIALFSFKKNNPTYAIRREESFNLNWQFKLGEQRNQSNWNDVSIPHIPKIEPLIVNNQWQGISWYKKRFNITDVDKKYLVRFGAVMHEADVWINEHHVAKHYGGYLPFVVDISGYVTTNETNEILVKVNNNDNPTITPGKPLEGLDFNFYGGIYREITLIEKNKINISDPILENKVGSGGTLVHFESISKNAASGTILVHVKNESVKDEIVYARCSLIDPRSAKKIFQSTSNKISLSSDHTFTVDIDIKRPMLWSPSNPNMYELTTELLINGQVIDQLVEKIGIRKIELKEDGFYLNDRKNYIRGTNRHQEYPYVGYAIPKNADYRDAVKIKQAGFDFVRLSHYPHGDSFLSACDELGIMVMNAIPGWQFYGDSSFVKNSYQDIRDMVRRDRNHPSVIFWEVSLNESGMTNEYMINANQILKQELPYGDTYSAGWIDHPSYDLYIPARQHGKAPFYWNDYRLNKRHVFIAEYGDWEYYAQNAGFNQAAFEGLNSEERTSRQLRQHGEKRLLQQALNFQEAANSNRKGLGTIGHANWLMFDYNRGYANDLEASGISDIFRIPKFAYYFYQSQRDPGDTAVIQQGTGPMVKIASYWNSSSNNNIRVFSNCEQVALYLNNKLVEKKGASKNEYSSHLRFPPFSFNVEKFKPGKLEAFGYINNERVSQDIVRSPIKAQSILLEIDESTKSVAKNDLVFVYAKIIDENGTILTDATHEITFNAIGGQLIGSNPIKAEAGIASILLKTSNETDVTIRASSKHLNTHDVKILSLK